MTRAAQADTAAGTTRDAPPRSQCETTHPARLWPSCVSHFIAGWHQSSPTTPNALQGCRKFYRIRWLHARQERDYSDPKSRFLGRKWAGPGRLLSTDFKFMVRLAADRSAVAPMRRRPTAWLR